MIIQGGVNITGGVGFLNPTAMPSTVEYLVVAGGGAGGGGVANYSTGGGGGAGGYLTGTSGTTNTNVGRTYADSAYTASGWTTGTDYTGSTGAFAFYFGLQQSSGGARTVPLPEVDTYFEILLASSTNLHSLLGLCRDTSAGGFNGVPCIYLDNGTAYGGLSGGTSLGAFAAGDVFCIAYKASTNKVYFGKNGTWYADPNSTVGATIPGTGNLRFIIMGGSSAGSYANGTFRVNTQNTYTAPSGYTTMASSITVTVGAGGTGAAATVGTSGANSVFSTITSIGGGRGSANGAGAQVGGSGGGGSSNTLGTYSAGTAGQGYAGGDPSAGYPYPSGGGGGAGAVGGTGGSGAGGPGIGGVGLSSSISGTATYYAGGGGGSLVISGTGGAGGNGGGGAGGTPGGTGVSGTANTGGGGGGSGGTVSAAGTGGSGGSGIVIIRYEDTYLAASSTTGSPTITVAGGYRIYTWTTSGSISFVPPPPSTVEYLVVAGGGGGGASNAAAGGGAGGYSTATGLAVASGSAITVTVGAGGAGSTSGSVNASNGQNSLFSTITSVGGGGGASDTSGNGSIGGSGGGAAADGSGFVGGAAYAGYGSNYFDNTGDYLTAPANIALAMGSGAFTFEAWVYNVGGFSTDPIFESRSSYTSASGYAFLITSSGYLNVYTNSSFVGQSSTALVSGTWYHVALVRTGTGSNQTTYYINGVASGTITLSGNFTDASTVVTTIGGSTSAGENFSGYISNARIVKGTAVYTGAFTPPTAPLAATQSSGTNISAITGTQTSLLTCQSNRFVDASTNQFAITVYGNTAWNSTTPFVPYSAYWVSQGNKGGDFLQIGPNYGGGGGGGASAAGVDGSGTTGGNGGAGTASSISSSSVTYAGGGGGGTYNGGTAGTGGAGGGGNAGTWSAQNDGTAGTVNTGGGGGGASYTGKNGGAGGSGIVIIRYLETSAAATATTGSPTVTTTGGYRIYTWTSSGSVTF